MKKLITLILALTLLLCLTACKNKKSTPSTGGENKRPTLSTNIVNFPLEGFYGIDRDIIIEISDPISYTAQEFVFVKNAYHYQDGQLSKLEAFETEINIKDDVSKQGNVSIPIKYFICQNTVYPYVNVNPHLEGINSFKIKSIYGNSENILIYGTGILGTEPIIYNIKNGKYQRLFTETESCIVVDYPAGVDADGKYVVVSAGYEYDLEDGNGEYYVINLKNGESQKIPIPNYDNYKYTDCAITPQRFIGNELLITYEFICDFNTEENYRETYYYNIETNKLREWDNEISFDSDLSGSSDDYFIWKKDLENGSIQLFNLKTNKLFSYTAEPQTDIVGIPNKSGQFLLSGYSTSLGLGYDDNGNIVYKEHEESYPTFLINFEKSEKVDITKFIKDFTIDTYKEYPVVVKYWVDETHLMITYYAKNEFYTEILDLKSAMK